MDDIIHAFKESLKKLNEEYICQHRERYENDKKDTKIHLGQAPSLSHFFETKLCKEIAKVYPKYHYYIDYPITFYDAENKKKTLRPDISVVEKRDGINILKGIIEVKIDIGRLDFDKTKDNDREAFLTNAIKADCNSIVASYYKKAQEINYKIPFKIPKKYTKIFILATNNNQHKHGGQPKSNVYDRYMSDMGYEYIVLMDDVLINTGEAISDKIEEEIDKKADKIRKAFRFLRE